MKSCMAHYFATLFVVSTNIVVLPVSCQCTVQGCEVGDASISIVAEIQEIKKQQDIIIESLHAVDRRSLEQDVCMKQIQGIYDLLNASCQQMSNQQEAVLTTVMSIAQAVDRRSQEQDVCMKQVQGIYDFLNASVLQLRHEQDTQADVCNRREQDIRVAYVISFHKLLNASLHKIQNQQGTIMTSLQDVERRLQEQIHSIKESQNESYHFINNRHEAVMTSLQTADLRSQEQVQSMFQFLNSSIQQMKNQQDIVTTNLQGDNRRSQEQVQSMFQFLNSSLQQMKNQQDIVTTNLQADQRRSQEKVQSTFKFLNSSLQKMKTQQDTVATNRQADHRRSQEQVQSMFQFLNSSFHQMKTQQDTVTTNLQSVDRLLIMCGISINNQTQILWKLSKAFGTDDWIVIMHRFDGSLNFDRNWTDYRNGFGDKERGEFWLGNEKIHYLTSRFNCTLRIEVQLKTSRRWYSAEYSSFSVDSENNKYTLRISGYSGNAGDSITSTSLSSGGYLDGMKFTTRDNDNDRSGFNCGSSSQGGWWFNYCDLSCLTCNYGIYSQWVSLNHLESGGLIRSARMMIRSK